MHPARSLILFTTLSGFGFGLLVWLGIDPSPPMGWVAFAFFGLGFALALSGLAASAFHLGHPERALRAFTQWQSSWLSREACLSVAALVVSGLHAAALVLFGTHIAPLGWLSALLCLATITATAMIYTQLRTVPRWHHWSTPALFALTGLAGGALLSGRTTVAAVLLAATGLAQLGWWLSGDRREATHASTRATATGLGARGAVRPFEPPHTGDSYLTREMAFVVARKHAQKLRVIALVLMAGLPALLLLAAPGHVTGALALMMHLAGTLVARWLFFAEARHVMALYYPPRVERQPMLKPVLLILLLPLPALADTSPRCAVLAQKALSGWAQVLSAQDAGTEKDALDRLTNVVSLHNGLNCQPSALAEAMDCVALQARAGHDVAQAAETCLQKADLAPPQQ